METIQKEKVKKLLPELRFEGFDVEWRLIKLGDLAEKIGDGLHGTPIYSDNSDIHFINGNNLTNGKIEITDKTKKVDFSVFTKNDKGLNENSILISLNGTIGNISKYNNEKVMLGKSVGYFNFKENTDFYFHVFHTAKIQNFFISELTGSTIKNLSLKTLRETIFPFPSLPEQQKIASFLSAVDEKIQQLTRKKELLEQYKKGVMQQLFSGKLRFKDENGEEYPDWEEKRLMEVSVFLDGKRKPIKGEDRSKMKGIYPYYGASGIIDYVNDYIFDEELILLGEDGENIVSRNLPLAFRVSGKCWVNNHAHVIKPINNNNIDFLTYSLERINYVIYNTGTAQPKLNQEVCRNIPLLIPSIFEQAKIANFLSNIDTKIESTTQQMTQTQTFKKGLLQKMFV